MGKGLIVDGPTRGGGCAMHTLGVALPGPIGAVAGTLPTSRITSGQPNAAQGLELSVISACVLGGVVVGVMIMGIAENAMNLLNIQAFYQYLVRGVILLLAVLLDTVRARAVGRRS